MPMRLLHIGTGVRGRQWLQVVRDYPDAHSVALVNPDPRALEEAQRIVGTGVPVFAHLEEALGRVAADAALIASPSRTHAEQAIRCLAAGLHVMVEKPLAMSVADGLRVIAAADRAGRHAMVAENFRFFRAERTVRRWIEDGRVGAIRAVSCVDRRRQPPEELGPFAAALPEPQLVEIAVHHFDSFRYLFGRQPVGVSARIFNTPGSLYQHGAGTAALLEMEHGLVIQYLGVLTSHRHEYELFIDGEHGALWTDRKRVWWRKRGGRFFVPVRLVDVPKGDARPYPWAGMTALLDNLRDAVQRGRPPETLASDGIWTIAMIEAASRAHHEDRRVRITDLPDWTEPDRRCGTAAAPSRAPRLLVVGLDSADADLIDQWCAEGHLPVLQSLREQGVWGRLGTTADRLHVSAWASFYTGTGADKHGLYHAYVMTPGRQSPQRARADASPEPVFWKLLSDAGKRCIVMDAFMSCPLEPFHGVQILEYGTWSAFCDPMTLPPELHAEIRAKFGVYPAEDQSKVLRPPDCAGFRDRLVRAATKKAEIARWLMGREPWDFFFVTFGEPHGAGHYLWHLHDAAYPAHPTGSPPALHTALRDVYVAIDRAIGEMLAGLDADTSVLILSVDGMGPNYSGSHLLEPLLQQMGLTRTERLDAAPAGVDHRTSSPGRRDLIKQLRDRVPLPVRAAISTRLPRRLQQRLSVRWMTADLDWSKTRAFLISNANEGLIRLNVRGREPQGIVEPGPEYDRLCDDLVTTLRGCLNSRNGRSAVERVWRADRTFSGACLPRLPDVVVNWAPSAEITTELLAPEPGILVTAKPPYQLPPFYVGNHRPAAFVIARGPGVPIGAVVDGGHILDLAPTVLAYFGLDGTPAMTGKAMPAVLPIAGH